MQLIFEALGRFHFVCGFFEFLRLLAPIHELGTVTEAIGNYFGDTKMHKQINVILHIELSVAPLCCILKSLCILTQRCWVYTHTTKTVIELDAWKACIYVFEVTFHYARDNDPSAKEFVELLQVSEVQQLLNLCVVILLPRGSYHYY